MMGGWRKIKERGKIMGIRRGLVTARCFFSLIEVAEECIMKSDALGKSVVNMLGM